MELGLDNRRSRHELARRLRGKDAGHPEWRALLARLSASYAARLAIEGADPFAPAPPGGSFDRGLARIMHHYGSNSDQSLRDVNRSDLNRGKAPGGMVDDVDGRQASDDRGWE